MGGGLRVTLGLPQRTRGHRGGGPPYLFDPRIQIALHQTQQVEDVPKAGGIGQRAVLLGVGPQAAQRAWAPMNFFP